MKKIGSRGFSQFDEEVIREGKATAEKAFQEAEIFNKKLQETYGMSNGENYQFLRDPQYDYDYHYNRYLKIIWLKDNRRTTQKRLRHYDRAFYFFFLLNQEEFISVLSNIRSWLEYIKCILTQKGNNGC